MKKRLLSMLMAVLMIASLVPATALAADTTADDPYGVNRKADATAKEPGITVKDDGKGGYDVTITPFAKIKDQCKVCTNLEKEVLIEADCTKAGLTVYYCGDCGKQMMDPVVTEKTPHSYEFEVVEEPTCTESGWGYAVCQGKGCGKAVAILNSADAVALLPADAKADTVKAVKALYDATGHDDAVLLGVDENDIYADDGETLLVKAKVEAGHAITVAGKAVSYDKEGNIVSATVKGAKTADVTGYTGDKYCPTCYAVIEAGTAVDSLDVAHKAYMKVIDEGKEPYIDADGDKENGITDTVYCAKCDETFYGVELDYNTYFAVEEEETPVIGQSTKIVNAKEATCCEEGYTGDTMTYLQAGVDKDGKAVGAWTVTAKGEVIPKLEHDFSKYVDIDPTCTEAGMKAEGWYVCTNVVGKDANGKDIICTETKHDLIYKAPYEVPATGHNFKEVKLVEASENNTGLSVLKCTVCGAYEMDGDNVKIYTTHDGACVADDERINVKEATCLEKGYTGDVVCKICGIVMTKGEETDLADHKFVNGKCEVCGAEDPDYVANPFNDVKEGDEFYNEILWAANEKLVNGYTDGSFKAGNTITRAEVVTMLWRQAGSPEAKTAASFADVAADAWYAKAVAWAVEKGITEGTSATTFEPEKACTRGEIVTFLWRANDKPTATAAADFTDLTENWYKDAVAWAAEVGVTKGEGNGIFNPDGSCTRGQVAAFMFRLADAK